MSRQKAKDISLGVYSKLVAEKLVDSCLEFADLGIGTTEESFHLLGKVPVEIEWLNNLVTSAAMLVATAFNMHAS